MATGGTEDFEYAYSDSEPGQRFVKSVPDLPGARELRQFSRQCFSANTVRMRRTTNSGRRP